MGATIGRETLTKIIMETDKRIVEIGGVRMEVDMRTAKVISEYKVGDNVRLLVKNYGDDYTIYPAVIVAFDDFKKLPTIVVAYLKLDYATAEIQFAYINRKTDADEAGKFELAPANYLDETKFKKSSVLSLMQGRINKLKSEIHDIEDKREFFLHHFEKYFKDFGKDDVGIPAAPMTSENESIF